MSDHMHHLRAVLQVLRDNSLTAKENKCTFASTQVEYLGHIIHGQGVATDPAKIEPIRSWPTPKDVTQLRSFLCLTGYYRRFVHNYSLIDRPLHDLLKKDSFIWETRHTQAFHNLKEKMCSAPVLALPDFSLPFTLENDASETGIGVVLM
jgi:hypothetical protein